MLLRVVPSNFNEETSNLKSLYININKKKLDEINKIDWLYIKIILVDFSFNLMI